MKRPRIFFSALAYWMVGLPIVVGQEVAFNRDVRPILAEKCFACHGFDSKHRQADLRLDSFEGATAARDGKPGIEPGNIEGSLLWERMVSHDPDEKMPPASSNKEPLSDAELQIIRRWIEQGARYDRHWAFVAPQHLPIPKVPGAEHPIDAFIQARLLQERLSPSPRASLPVLIRRVSLDLTGLPPTAEEVDDFVQAAEQDFEAAYRNVIDRLLQSPHYGERWGRWWLDQARYADSNGYSIDAPRQIWKFRDWVITALNDDMPFDQFTREQLAGDLLPNASESQKIATGFHRNTQINQEGGIDKEQFRIDSIFDRVATTGTVWLGLTVGCAQCHDHKFDPIEQKEFYRLFAFFNNQNESTLKVFDESQDIPKLREEYGRLGNELKDMLRERQAELDAWEASLTNSSKKLLSATVRKALGVAKEQRKLPQQRALFAAIVNPSDPFRVLDDRYAELDELLNQGITTLVLEELPEPRTTTVFIKGDFTRPADRVMPGTPAMLHRLEQTVGNPTRLDLANWLVDPKNPLTARVIVNRVWQQYFGRGIVETDNDFGLQGTSPSHPELLDWLALEFIQNGWSLKDLHRTIVNSSTYRQSSSDTPELREKDPGNYLLARQTRLRLDAEIVRDVALIASGLMTLKVGGPPVFPPIPEGVMGQGQVKRVWTESQGGDRYRRGMYTFVYRASPPPALNVFDAPDGFSSCTRRIRSNTPLQALTLMNDRSFFEFAKALEQIIHQAGLKVAFKRCTARNPSQDELEILEQLDALNAARAMLNLDETVTRE